MLADDSLKILIVEQSHDEANRIISILRSADYRMDPQLACDEQQLQKYLSQRNWDLLISPTGEKLCRYSRYSSPFAALSAIFRLF